MLSALRHRNFRLYFTAQIVSNVGTWVQITVENWLVLQLSHSGLALGVTNGCSSVRHCCSGCMVAWSRIVMNDAAR
jgi:hypothetical protein